MSIVSIVDKSGDNPVEMKVHTWLKNNLKKRYENLWLYKAPGGRYGRKGVPDMLVNIDGHFIAIEVKRASGKLTLHQKYEADRIDKSNGLMIVLYGRDKSIFDVIDKYIEAKPDHSSFTRWIKGL
jgi:hypothetical protein